MICLYQIKKGNHYGKNPTIGSVFKNIVWFSLPYLLSYFLQTLYGLADLFIIGQYDKVASTTAVSVGSQIMHMITVMIVGLAMGITVNIAQAIGANDKKQAAKEIGNTIILFMGVAVVGMIVLLLSVYQIVSVMSTPAEAVNGTVTYLTIGFIGIPFITAYNIISAIFRGMGDSKSPMYFIAVACIANILLDYLFMGAFKLGPAGAALGAQNIGADKPERAIATLRYAILIATGFGILATIIIQFTAGPIVALFTDGNTASGADVIRLGSRYLRGYIFDCIFAGIHFSFGGYFCACGKSGLSFLHNIIAIVMVRIPGVYLTSQMFQATLFPMGLATAAGSLLSVLICIAAFCVIRRKESTVKGV